MDSSCYCALSLGRSSRAQSLRVKVVDRQSVERLPVTGKEFSRSCFIPVLSSWLSCNPGSQTYSTRWWPPRGLSLIGATSGQAQRQKNQSAIRSRPGSWASPGFKPQACSAPAPMSDQSARHRKADAALHVSHGNRLSCRYAALR